MKFNLYENVSAPKCLKLHKTLYQIIKKLLTQKMKKIEVYMKARYRLHSYCHVTEIRYYLFENLFRITSERGEVPLRIGLCEEIPDDMINHFLVPCE